jgi:hypothetical protein
MPTLLEVLHSWMVFSVVFELLLPRLTMFNSVADPWDSVAYFVGGFVAYCFWNRGRSLRMVSRMALGLKRRDDRWKSRDPSVRAT